MSEYTEALDDLEMECEEFMGHAPVYHDRLLALKRARRGPISEADGHTLASYQAELEQLASRLQDSDDPDDESIRDANQAGARALGKLLSKED